MPKTIAVTGKGGVGKTVVSALTVITLVERGVRPLLAVDADPNQNLDGALGMTAAETVGGLRESARERSDPGMEQMSTAELLQMRIRESLVEGIGFDLIAMGRPEGRGCYCFANNILRNALDRLSGAYRAVVIDCEAGLEHLSRRTTGDVDLLLALSDPSLRGLQTARRALDLVDEVETRIGQARVILNRTTAATPESLERTAAELGLEIAAWLPEDPHVRALDAAGRPLTELPADSPMRRAVADVLKACGFVS